VVRFLDTQALWEDAAKFFGVEKNETFATPNPEIRFYYYSNVGEDDTMVVRKRSSSVLHDFQQFMYYRSQESTGKSQKTSFSTKLKKFLEDNVREPDEDGSYVYKFGRPVYIGEKQWTGFQKKCVPGADIFDEDAAMDLAASKGVLPDVMSDVTITVSYAEYLKLADVQPREWFKDVQLTVDQNAFYRLFQQGKLTEEEIDSLTSPGEPTYQFWPVEATAEEAAEADGADA
jgi:hypothetical protein